jgi:DNA-binding transcriptional ArsR family regulator
MVADLVSRNACWILCHQGSKSRGNQSLIKEQEHMNSPKQQEILDLLADQDNMTAAEIAKEMKMVATAIAAHLRRLEEAGHIYVCEWRSGKYGVPTKAYKYGKGDSVEFVGKRKAPNKKIKNTIVIEKIEIDAPRPDYASAWLFNEPKVELLGARYE